MSLPPCPLATTLQIPMVRAVSNDGKPSSNIHSIGYDKPSNTLRVKFHEGAVYDHSDFGARDYKKFEAANSKGGYYNAHIKDNEMWPCTRIDAGVPTIKTQEALGNAPLNQKLGRISSYGGPLQISLEKTRVSMGQQYASLPYLLWVACGKEITKNRTDSRFHQCLKLIGEASGCNTVGGQYVEAAIKLAKARGV